MVKGRGLDVSYCYIFKTHYISKYYCAYLNIFNYILIYIHIHFLICSIYILLLINENHKSLEKNHVNTPYCFAKKITNILADNYLQGVQILEECNIQSNAEIETFMKVFSH